MTGTPRTQEDLRREADARATETNKKVRLLLESAPSNQTLDVEAIIEPRGNCKTSPDGRRDAPGGFDLNLPEAHFYCPRDGASRWFQFDPPVLPYRKKLGLESHVVRCRCKNCGYDDKFFMMVLDHQRFAYNFSKVAEWPSHGERIPSNVLKMFDSDGSRDLFLRGRQSENQGLGIGAYTYYRRVVDNQRNRLIDKLISVIEQLDEGKEHIGTLKAAKEERQFDKALKMVRPAIPKRLFIQEKHNPIQILYRALSDGLHNQSDETCLTAAKDIRNVLTDLLRRMRDVLEHDASLNQSIDALKDLTSKLDSEQAR